MKLGLIILPIFLISLVACKSGGHNKELPKENQTVESLPPSQEPIEDPTPSPTPSAPYSRPGPSNFKAVLIDGENPNEYSVKLTWIWSKKYQGRFKIIRTEMTSKDEAVVESVELESSAREYLDDHRLSNGCKYSYSIHVENQIDSIGEMEINIPIDVVFDSGENLLEKKFSQRSGTFQFDVHRVFFEKDSVLISNGKNIEIRSDVLFIDDAVINTRVLLPWVNWILDSGNLVISKNFPFGLSGGNAGYVSILANQVRKKSENQKKIKILANGGPGATGHSGAYAIPKGPAGRIVCPSPHDGFPGGDGGDGGNVFIEIKDNPDQIQLETLEILNIGGVGGEGGQFIMFGKNGPQGKSGKTGNICLKLEEKSVGCIH
jgi:hypothetical protein